METEKGLSGQKLNINNTLAEAAWSPFLSTLAEKTEQLDKLIRCLEELEYDLSKKVRQIDIIINQGNGVIIDEDDNKLEHLNSLTKLAERTLVEADKLAESIKMEAEEKASAKSAKIVAEAEKRAEREADRIATEAKQRAKEVATEKARNILGGITEIKDMFEKAYQEVVSNLDNTEQMEAPSIKKEESKATKPSEP